MKRNISDLLDSYKENDIDLRFDGALDLKRIKELTMKKVKSTGGRRRFTPVRVLLIAAVVAAITCSALAVGYSLRAGDWFKDFFGTAEAPISTEQREVLNDIGATFDGSVTSNGTTVTPIAAIADENVYYLRLRIEAPEGTVLPEYDQKLGPFYQLSGNTAENRLEVIDQDDSMHRASWCMDTEWLQDDDPTDNVKEVVLKILAQPGTETSFADGTSWALYFHGLWIQTPDKEYTHLLSGDFKIDMGRYKSRAIKLDCEGLSWYCEKTDCTSTLQALSISPVSVSFFYSYAGVNETRYFQPAGPLSVGMKDGTEIEIGLVNASGGDSDGNMAGSYVFSTPLDLTQVDYVMYADQRIDLPE